MPPTPPATLILGSTVANPAPLPPSIAPLYLPFSALSPAATMSSSVSKDMASLHLHLKSPASPIMNSSALNTAVNKGATVFPSHVRRTFSRHPTDYTGELVRLLDDISTVTHSIAAYVQEGSEAVAYGSTSSGGALDSHVATRRLYKSLSHDGYACLILDRHTEAPLTMPEDAPMGGYVVMINALDKDDASVEQSICGTVFSVYKRRSPTSLPGRLKDIQQNLADQVAAGYVVYSSATTLYYTLGGSHGVYSFCLHPVATQYFLQPSSALGIPDTKGVVYGDRTRVLRDQGIGKAILLFGGAPDAAQPKMFDTGSLLGNFNGVSMNGGVLVHFDCHVLCEAGPLALIVEQLGGKAVNAEGTRILDLAVTDEVVHQTTTLVAGSQSAIDAIFAGLSSQ